MNEAVPRGSWALAAVLAALLLGVLTVFAQRNLPYTGLWYDEAVQFWLSLGLDPFTAPGGQPGGVVQVIRQNGRANLDPGGFSLLLHLWMRGGVSPAWLRLLPFGLFLVGLGAMARLGWVCRPSPSFAVFSAAVPLAYPLLLYHVTEVRAYTMEFAGVAVASLLLHRLSAELLVRGLARIGITLAVFMSSRYSYAIFAGAACLALAPAIWSRSSRDPRGRAWRLLALGVPVLGGTAFVAINLWLQRGRLTSQGGAYIQYLAPATSAGKSVGELVIALGTNLLSPVAIPVTLAAIVALMPSRWLGRCPTGLRGVGATQEARLLYRVAPGVLVLSAGLWRWHPWDVGQKWSLFLHALSAVLVVRLVADILAGLMPEPPSEAPKRTSWRVETAGTALVALLVVGLSVHTAAQRRVHWSDLTPALMQLERMPLGAGSVAVGVHPYPILRYLCEYGPFVGRLSYPDAFRLPYWGGPKPVIGRETRYIIAHERPDTLARMHAGFAFRVVPGWPVHLYVVEPVIR